jgi:hypothetical protein
MLSKIRAGVLSCIGLMVIHLLKGIGTFPNIEIENFMVYLLTIKIGFLWFSITLWMVLRFDFVQLNGLKTLREPLDWLIRNIAIVSGTSIVLTVFPYPALFFIIRLVSFILLINYIIVYIKLYRFDKNDLIFIGDIHNYILTMIVMIIAFFFVKILNEYIWHCEIDFIFNILSAFPIIFLIRFLFKEKRDIKNRQNIFSVEND